MKSYLKALLAVTVCLPLATAQNMQARGEFVSQAAPGTWNSGVGPSQIGNEYCSDPLDFQIGTLTAFGSETVAQNDVRLVATGLPSNVTGFFLVGEAQAFIQNPAGSMGDLCLGGRIGRFNRADQIRNSGAGGSYELILDLNDFRMNPSQAVVAGETWHFQSWYRIPSGILGGNSDSNFTTALSITFN